MNITKKLVNVTRFKICVSLPGRLNSFFFGSELYFWSSLGDCSEGSDFEWSSVTLRSSSLQSVNFFSPNNLSLIFLSAEFLFNSSKHCLVSLCLSGLIYSFPGGLASECSSPTLKRFSSNVYFLSNYLFFFFKNF